MFELSALPKISFHNSPEKGTLDLAGCAHSIMHAANTVTKWTPLTDSVVGLLFPTGSDLILAWLGVVASGRVPLMLPYPNERGSKTYWKESVSDAIVSCGVRLLLCSPKLSSDSLESLAQVIYIEDLEAFDHPALEYSKPLAPTCIGVEPVLIFPSHGHILQLSSGTTGSKKPVSLSFEALLKHTTCYNQVLLLGSKDRIISWLPLYHDMGFIACFVMPLLLGVPVTFLDPNAWVREPQLLFNAIKQDSGTVCYMPNFGFEVMAKLGISGPFPSIRQWISCSEPTYSKTLERFMAATGAAPETISTCYGMAENVFAVSQSVGMQCFEQAGKQYVSCGHPVPGTQVKQIDGEFFVRSPYSIKIYANGSEACDPQGFYATGDCGFFADGQIIITGRMHDVANIGGRKYMLNDLDIAIGQVFPAAAGRIASLTAFDATIGTEKAIFLLEDERFWENSKREQAAVAVREATGLESAEVHLVPPRFITKTSSGKINRVKTIEQWRACQSPDDAAQETSVQRTMSQELIERFPGVPFDTPIERALDSLGLLVVRMLCEEHSVEYVPTFTLRQVCDSDVAETKAGEAEVFSIIALVDGWRLGFEASEPVIDANFLDRISKEVGGPVHIEHICVPPVSILFSDLIFQKFFLPKNPDPAYNVVASLLGKIRNASLLLVDDEDNFRTPPFCAYPVLDHQFVMHPDAELLGHRMQRYTQNHHLLPRRIVLGREITPDSINPTLQDMESMLGIPILKIAFHAEYRSHTDRWDCLQYKGFISDADKVNNPDWSTQLEQTLLSFIRRRADAFHTRPGRLGNRFVLVDSPHFCSFLLNRAAVDFVVNKYESFCLVGLRSSLPYLQRRLEACGKAYFFSSQAIPIRDDYECLILIGGVGGKMPTTSKPTYDFVHAREEGHGGGRPHNVTDIVNVECPPLAACDESLFRSVRERHGVLIGNYLLNNTIVTAEAGPR